MPAAKWALLWESTPILSASVCLSLFSLTSPTTVISPYRSILIYRPPLFRLVCGTLLTGLESRKPSDVGVRKAAFSPAHTHSSATHGEVPVGFVFSLSLVFYPLGSSLWFEPHWWSRVEGLWQVGRNRLRISPSRCAILRQPLLSHP